MRLQENVNLLYWYKHLYEHLFEGFGPTSGVKILEIGSGASPLKLFRPDVITSDVLELEYLDHAFDCHEINRYDGIEDSSIDVITLTNVLHHLKDPIQFLRHARMKLKETGAIWMVEPYFSVVSTPIYRWFHHEPVQFGIKHPVLDEIEGPLSTANQAIPYLMFVTKRNWLDPLAGHYNLERLEIEHFSSISYMMSGGMSWRIPLPGWLYRAWFPVDELLAKRWPRIFASFFVVRLHCR